MSPGAVGPDIIPPPQPPPSYPVPPVESGGVPPGPTATQSTPAPESTYPWDPVQTSDAAYSEGGIDVDYDEDMGVLALPVAGPSNQGQEIIRVHAPSGQRRVEFTIERVGSPPQAPSVVTNNPSEVLKTRKVRLTTPALSPDGQHVYRLSGVYVYELILPPAETDRLSAGAVPWDQTSPSANDVTPDQWSQNLSDSSSSVPAGFVPPSQ